MPFQYDRGVEPARISEHDLLRLGGHLGSCESERVRKRRATASGLAPFRSARKSVSSPQIVPTTSGKFAWSRARPTRWAEPGGVFMTMRFPAASPDCTQSARMRSEGRRVGKEGGI